MFHSIRAGASPNRNSYADPYANTDSCAYADANGYSYPNTNEHSARCWPSYQYFDTSPNAYFYAGI